MENIFKTLAEIIKPEPVKKYMVETETKGKLYFDELPKGTYFLGGFRDEADKGKATFYTCDGGTCLIPIIDTATGKQVCILSRSGQSI